MAEASLESAKFNRRIYEQNTAAYSGAGAQSTLEELNAAQTIYNQVKALAEKANGAAAVAPGQQGQVASVANGPDAHMSCTTSGLT